MFLILLSLYWKRVRWAYIDGILMLLAMFAGAAKPAWDHNILSLSLYNLPFVGLPDPKHTILKLRGQEVNLFKLGCMLAQVLVDKTGSALRTLWSLDRRYSR